MDSVKERFEKACQIAGIANKKGMMKEFAGLVKIPYGSLYNLLSRDKITSDAILKITDVVPISRTYLETGTGLADINCDGVSDYVHEDRVDELVKMYKELGSEDQRIIYQMTKRCWLSKPSMEF